MRQPVLIVDGDQEYCSFVSHHLSRAGYATRRVTTGGEAIDFVRRQRPAAILLDVSLPEACGYQVCHELRQEHGEPCRSSSSQAITPRQQSASRACSSAATTTS